MIRMRNLSRFLSGSFGVRDNVVSFRVNPDEKMVFSSFYGLDEPEKLRSVSDIEVGNKNAASSYPAIPSTLISRNK